MAGNEMSKAVQNALTVSYDVLGSHVELDLDFVKRYLVRGNPEKITDQEIVFFMNTCKMQKLNPLVSGEVYCMDKLIKYELGIEYYGRNMDDFWLIHPSKEYLKYCLDVIRAYLETLNLTLNGKTQIFPFKNGVNYLGFHTYVTPDGKAIRKLSNQKKRNAQKKYTRMAKLVAAGELPMEKLETSYTAHKAHRKHGNCYKMGKAMDERISAILQQSTDKEVQ